MRHHLRDKHQHCRARAPDGCSEAGAGAGTAGPDRTGRRPQSGPQPRILLETNAPFMVPSNMYGSLLNIKGRLPLCHSAMIPWVAEFAAIVAGGG